MFTKRMLTLLIVLVLVFITSTAFAAKNGKVGISVVLNTSVTDDILDDLENFGSVLNVYEEIKGITLKASADALEDIQALDYVASASLDAKRGVSPQEGGGTEDFADGFNTWNLDAINVTDVGFNNRVVAYDGEGVYVAVLDTGLVNNWPAYFPASRIASEYGISFGGGGADRGFVSSQPNKWEHDTDSHGTHVTSTIIGYSFGGTPITGVAPKATIIPVKVLNNNGSGWSSVIAAGILYVASLKEGALADYPVVINMSLGGPYLGAIEQAAIDYALSKGVIVVAAAGNEGNAGMGYPGAYEPVISVAAAGWYGEWYNSCWWYCLDVADPTNPYEFYITDFSSWAYPGQDLDVAAPGSWIVGPYQVNQGQLSYYFLGGTSMASPHVAGLVALMAQKFPALGAAQAETILENNALALTYWPAFVSGAGLVDAQATLAATP